MGDTPVATPITHSDDYADDQIAYRPGQTAQVEERSSMMDFPFSSLTHQLSVRRAESTVGCVTSLVSEGAVFFIITSYSPMRSSDWLASVVTSNS